MRHGDHYNSESGEALICRGKCKDLAWWKITRRIQQSGISLNRRVYIAFVLLNIVRVPWNDLNEMRDDEKLERYAGYFDKTWFDGHFRAMSWLMKTGTLTHTFQQLDNMLFLAYNLKLFFPFLLFKILDVLLW